MDGTVHEPGRRTWQKVQELMETSPPEMDGLSEEELKVLVRIGERLSAAAAKHARPQPAPRR